MYKLTSKRMMRDQYFFSYAEAVRHAEVYLGLKPSQYKIKEVH